MIPKIIHYSWFSNDPVPDFIQELMKSWKEILPDYELVLWDIDKLMSTGNKFAMQAVSVKKWAFAADFIRLYAVHKYGGIWFDTDVEVFKSLDSFLNNEFFIGREANTHGYNPMKCFLTAHVFGAVKNHPFLKDCLDYYADRSFIQSTATQLPETLRYDMRILPEIMAHIAVSFGYDWSNDAVERQSLKNGIEIYPYDYFDAPRYRTMQNVYTVHRAVGSWRSGNEDGMPDFSSTNPLRKDRKFYLMSINQKLKSIGIRVIPYK